MKIGESISFITFFTYKILGKFGSVETVLSKALKHLGKQLKVSFKSSFKTIALDHFERFGKRLVFIKTIEPFDNINAFDTIGRSQILKRIST